MIRGRTAHAFTLIELLVVLVILAVLAAIAIPIYVGKVEKARRDATIAEISNYKSALANFEVDNGRFPSTLEGLVHVSQIAMRRIARPGEVVKEGDKVKAKIQGIDMEKRRISLSMAEAERDAKIASGEIKPPEPRPGLAIGAGAAASAAGAKGKLPTKPRKPLKGGLF